MRRRKHKHLSEFNGIFGIADSKDDYPEVRPDVPDLQPSYDLLAPKFRDTVEAVSERLKGANIRYVLIGGMASNSYAGANARTTDDIDWLLDESSSKFVDDDTCRLRIRVTGASGGVPVDYMSTRASRFKLYREALNRAVIDSKESNGIPVISVYPLFLLKLKAMRPKDVADMVSILNAGGAERSKLVSYIRRNAPDLLEKLVRVLALAKIEHDGGDMGFAAVDVFNVR